MKYKCVCGFETENIREFSEHQNLCDIFKKKILEKLPKHKYKIKKSIKIYKKENENVNNKRFSG